MRKGAAARSPEAKGTQTRSPEEKGAKKGGALRSLRILIGIQMRSLIDRSFFKSKRAVLLKAGISVVLFAAVTAGFFAFFKISALLSVFSLGAGVPETVVTFFFTVIQIMATLSCMIGLSHALYRGTDNVILLVLPVSQSLVFLSKLAVYYIRELRRGLLLTVPLFLAYGIVCDAVWFYYPWMLFCFLFVTMLPVAAGAVLSIPAHYVPRVLSRVPVLKYSLIAVAAAGLIVGAFYVVGLIPDNINLLGQWGSITRSVRTFLATFCTVFYPWERMTFMMVGSSLMIARNPVAPMAAAVFFAVLGVSAVLVGISFLTARKLFLRMTAEAGETSSSKRRVKKNRVHSRRTSPFAEDILRSIRSGKAAWRSVIEFCIPALVLFALNRVYAAMNTSLAGQSMTAAFNILVLLVTVLTANTFLAHVYSRDGKARDLIKTRPVDFRLQLSARLLLRGVLSTLAAVAAAIVYGVISSATWGQALCFAGMAVCVNLAHVFWCAEIDVMHPEEKDANGNEAKATVFAVLLSVLFAAGYYLISGSSGALLKLFLIAAAFLALRTFLYFERVRLYFGEV